MRVLRTSESEVFEAMFSHEKTKEVIEKKVVIDDMSAAVMRRMLAFMYTGEVENKEKDLTVDLLIAADKVLLSLNFFNFFI